MKSFFKSKSTRERIEYVSFSVLVALTLLFAILPALPNLEKHDGFSFTAHIVDAEGDGGGGDGGGDGGAGAGGDGGGGDGSTGTGDTGTGDTGTGDTGTGDTGTGDTGTGDTGTGDTGTGDGSGDAGTGCCGDGGTGDTGTGDGSGDGGTGCCGDGGGGDGGGGGGTTPGVCSLTAPDSLAAGETGTLSWSTSNLTSIYINGEGPLSPSGSTNGSLTTTTTFTLTGVDGNGNTVVCSETIVIETPQAPVCDSFTVTPAQRTGAGNVTLAWNTSNGTVSINNSIGSVVADGSQSVFVSNDTTFTLTVTGNNQTDTCTVSVDIIPVTVDSLTCDAFTASPSTLNGSGNTTLSWNTSNASSVTINQGIGSVSGDGTRSVFVDASKTFTLTATRGNESVTCSVPVTVIPQTEPLTCDSFSASPDTLSGAGNTTLSWNTSNASSVTINQGIGSVSGDGTRSVFVDASKTFTLTATRGNESVTCTAPVTVENLPLRCESFTASPSSLNGSGNTVLSWDTSNASSVTINQGIGPVTSDGSRSVFVDTSKTFTLTATRGSESVTCTVPVTVTAVPEVNCDSLTASDTSLTGPGTTTLTWQTTNASSASLNQGIGSVAVDGSRDVFVDSSKTFVLTASNGTDSDICTLPITVTSTPSPLTCDAFTASPNSLTGSGTTTLQWATTNATGVTINQGVGSVSVDGSRDVFVDSSRTFTLTATRGSESVTCTVPVTVNTVTAPRCDSFTVSDSSVHRGDEVTLNWDTTNATNVSISPSVGSVSGDGSRSVTVSDDITYVLTAANGASSVTCQVSIDVQSSGGGGGGSSAPRCTLKISDTRINPGEKVTLSWKNTRTNDILLKDNHGKTLANSKRDDDIDADQDSIVVRPTKNTKYTLTAIRGSRERECTVEVKMDTLTVGEVRGISLTTIPYTGFDAGPFLTTVFYVLLGLWSVAVAYILVRRGSVMGLSLPGGAVGPERQLALGTGMGSVPYTPAPHTSFASAPAAPANLPVAATATPTLVHGYDAYYAGEKKEEDAPVQSEDVVKATEEVEMLEAHAHEARVLMSTDALYFIMAQTNEQHERITLLDMVIAAAKANFPKEDGWVVVNKERILELLK